VSKPLPRRRRATWSTPDSIFSPRWRSSATRRSQHFQPYKIVDVKRMA